MHKQFEFDGKKFNSAYWVLAHICWGQNMLLLQATNGPAHNYDWFEKVMIGSTFNPDDVLPDLREVLDAFKEIHATSVKHVGSITDAQLDEKNTLGISFNDEGTIRKIIQHHIRHEATHAGHLGWLCKMHGVKTF